MEACFSQGIIKKGKCKFICRFKHLFCDGNRKTEKGQNCGMWTQNSEEKTINFQFCRRKVRIVRYKPAIARKKRNISCYYLFYIFLLWGNRKTEFLGGKDITYSPEMKCPNCEKSCNYHLNCFIQYNWEMWTQNSERKMSELWDLNCEFITYKKNESWYVNHNSEKKKSNLWDVN